MILLVDMDAFFASVDYDLVPKVLTATLGGRYYRYVEDEVGSQYGTGGIFVNVPNGECVATPLGGGLDPDPVTGVRDKDFHKATYTGFKGRANITWHITSDAMVYATYSQGYRPGAFNRTTKGVTKLWVDAAGNPVPSNSGAGDHIVKQFVKPLAYKPDTLNNMEIGFKTELMNRRLQINGSIYQMDWKDVQTLIYNPPVYGNTTFGVNGATYRVKGFELQVTAKVTDGLTLMGSLSNNDAKQTNSPCIRSARASSLPRCEASRRRLGRPVSGSVSDSSCVCSKTMRSAAVVHAAADGCAWGISRWPGAIARSIRLAVRKRNSPPAPISPPCRLSSMTPRSAKN